MKKIALILLFVAGVFLIAQFSVGQFGFAAASEPEEVNNVGPQVALKSLSRIGIDSAIAKVYVKRESFQFILSMGVCWSEDPMPDINDASSSRAGFADSSIFELSKLVPATGYFVRPFILTSSGVIYGAQRNFATDNYLLQMKYKGGKLGYVLQPGDIGFVEDEFHGYVFHLIATNTSDFVTWTDFESVLIGGTDSVVGSGPSNTDRIVDVLGAGRYAAKLCADLDVNGYNDWFLPSAHEFEYLYRGYKTPWQFWTSTELSKDQAYRWSNAGLVPENKTLKKHLLAVRFF